MNEKVRKLVTMAMLAALSIVLVYVIHFPIFPAASFLEYDPADIPILIGTFAYGPLAGVLLTVVVSVIQGMTVSSGSGLMGIAMHIFATSILVLVAGNIYRVKHTKKGAVLALICGVLAMTAGMVVFNYFITPYFITPGPCGHRGGGGQPGICEDPAGPCDWSPSTSLRRGSTPW